MLKQLLIKKKLEALRNNLNTFLTREEEIKTKEERLVQDVENSTEELTDEEKELLEETADEITKEKETIAEQKASLEKEIAELEAELEELNNKAEDAVEEEEPKKDVEEKNRSRKTKREVSVRGGLNMNLERRAQIEKLVERRENKEFFQTVANLVTRAEQTTFTGKELLIPEEVMAMINQEIYGYGEVVKLVRKVAVKGTARVVVNAGTPQLFWTESCADLQEAVIGSLSQIELDGFKLGGYVFLCKAFIEDAIIDVADFIIKEFAQAIAIALDEAIVNGKGATAKEPEGILSVGLADVEPVEAEGILGVLGAVGGLSPKAKKVTMLVNRATYYKNVLPETYGKDANGKIVYGLGQTLPDGTNVVISEALEDGQFLLGDFYNGYILVERKGMTFDTSDQVRWIEEQIGYKTSGRYDGKVVDKAMFVKGTIVAPTPEIQA